MVRAQLRGLAKVAVRMCRRWMVLLNEGTAVTERDLELYFARCFA